MAFTSFTYLYFLAIVVALYWAVRNRVAQNVLLLVASYVFYGWLTPWYCLLLASSTIVTYICLHWLWNRKEEEKELIAVVVCVILNIGMLAICKYWNFWITDILATTKSVGWKLSKESLQIVLPIGMSFYTLQAVGITVDAYRNEVKRQSFLNIALFLAFFPKLIAGPFEKANAFLAQANASRTFDVGSFLQSFSLLLAGFLKKLVIAENIKIYVDQIFFLKDPSIPLLLVGGVGFMIQIYADFSGYTDIARGSARLLGINLMENFNSPYLAVSPSDFWGRWHISLSRWFREYIYIPLGGSRSHAITEICWALMITMCLSGLWHGPTSNYFAWGLYHGMLISAYLTIGIGGHWKPVTGLGTAIATILMLIWTLIGWIIFRCSDLAWLIKIILKFDWHLTQGEFLVTWVFLSMYLVYILPWLGLIIAERLPDKYIWLKAPLRATIVMCIVILGEANVVDFIYVNF